MADEAEDNMEISSEHNANAEDDFDIDLGPTTDQVDEDYPIGGVADQNDVQPSPAPGTDDLMVDDDGGDTLSFHMEDAEEGEDQPVGMSFEADPHNDATFQQDSLQEHEAEGIETHDFATIEDDNTYVPQDNEETHPEAADNHEIGFVLENTLQIPGEEADGEEPFNLEIYEENGQDLREAEREESTNEIGFEVFGDDDNEAKEAESADTHGTTSFDNEGELDFGDAEEEAKFSWDSNKVHDPSGASIDPQPAESFSDIEQQLHAEDKETVSSSVDPPHEISTAPQYGSPEPEPRLTSPLASAGSPNQTTISGAKSPDHKPVNGEADQEAMVKPLDDLNVAPRNQDVPVRWRDVDYKLFSTSESDDPDTYFLSDFSITTEHFTEFFKAIREIIDHELAADELLCLHIVELNLIIEEDSCAGQDATLGSIMNLRDLLYKNDGIESTEYLPAIELILFTKPSFSAAYAYLAAQAADGKGKIELIPQSSENSQGSHDGVDDWREDEHIAPGADTEDNFGATSLVDEQESVRDLDEGAEAGDYSGTANLDDAQESLWVFAEGAEAEDSSGATNFDNQGFVEQLVEEVHGEYNSSAAGLDPACDKQIQGTHFLNIISK
jgi:hypothetical protein